jgi:hypothetical protein
MAKVSTQMFFELFEEIVGEEFFEFWDLISKRWLLQRFVSTWMMVSLPVRELFVAFFSLGASSMDKKNFVGNTAGSAGGLCEKYFCHGDNNCFAEERSFSVKGLAVLSMMHP